MSKQTMLTNTEFDALAKAVAHARGQALDDNDGVALETLESAWDKVRAPLYAGESVVAHQLLHGDVVSATFEGARVIGTVENMLYGLLLNIEGIGRGSFPVLMRHDQVHNEVTDIRMITQAPQHPTRTF